MARDPTVQTLRCVVAGADPEGLGLCVRYTPKRGFPPELVDHVVLGPEGEVDAVRGVGRLLRVLRAARQRAPAAPYRLSPEEAAEFLQRCRGTEVVLQVKKRFERVLSVWTESGVERFGGVIDYQEEADGLAVKRRGGRSTLLIPRESLIRYEASALEHLEVIAVD